MLGWALGALLALYAYARFDTWERRRRGDVVVAVDDDDDVWKHGGEPHHQQQQPVPHDDGDRSAAATGRTSRAAQGLALLLPYFVPSRRSDVVPIVCTWSSLALAKLCTVAGPLLIGEVGKCVGASPQRPLFVIGLFVRVRVRVSVRVRGRGRGRIGFMSVLAVVVCARVLLVVLVDC
jgi:hypothetical protein